MTPTKKAGKTPPDVPSDLDEWLATGRHILDKQLKLGELLAGRLQDVAPAGQLHDPLGLQQGVIDYWAYVFQNPDKIMAAQARMASDMANLLQNAAAKAAGHAVTPVITHRPDDRRFRDPRWVENPVFDTLRQSYLLGARWLQDMAASYGGQDKAIGQRMAFAARQFADATSPSNFWLTNPEVLEATLQTRGENLLRGMDNLLNDLKGGTSFPKISMVKPGSFAVGENLAVTPGKVVFQNDLLQLIQYAPATARVFKTPLLIVSPWINKYYILDMQAENSFVRWCVEQGHTVFITSWANPDERHASLTWDDYMFDGLDAAIRATCDATGERDINVIGYCIGGTLLTTLLAYRARRGEAARVKSATFFTAMVDFADAGELALFTDEAQIAQMEKMMARKGYLDAWHLHTTFNMLRANDLIWSFVVNNYLLGREPFPFDLLHWNSDSTRIPAKVHSYYLRNMYLHNNLAKPDALTIRGTPLDVRRIDTPSYFISAADDHIAPWQTTYAGAKLLGGEVSFTLAGSGHIAGIVNHPARNKYQYWTHDAIEDTAQDWQKNAVAHTGSWWPHWAKWLARHGGKKVAARVPGSGKLKAIENAPGSYVKVQAL